MEDVVWLDILCPRCHGVIEAQFMAWPPDGPVEDNARWVCPYCATEHRLGVAGYLALVTRKPEVNELAINRW